MSWAKVGTHGRCEVFQKGVGDGHLTVIVGREPIDVSRGLFWHLSISHRLSILDPVNNRPIPGRIPTYEELKEARYRFCPDEVTMAQIFPPKSEFVNLHETTLHLWEIEK